MTQKVIPYNIGLDIGTNSVGWAVTDNENKLLHIKGHNGIGVRLFKEGQSAAERCGFRTTRRRLSRRKWRLRLLNEIFADKIAKVDPSFFARLKQSNVSPKDPNKTMFGNILFDNGNLNDKSFHDEYKTIYHLRQSIIDHPEKKFDIRLIYLAMHHIIKYRGHFLNQANVQDFKGGKIDLEESFKDLNSIFENQGRDLRLVTEDANKYVKELSDNSKTRNDRQKELSKVLYIPIDKNSDKNNKKVTTEIIKAILGMKAKFDVIFGIDAENAKEWILTFNSDDFDDKIEGLSAQMTDEAGEILLILKELYFALNLSDILNNSVTDKNAKTLSEAMINRYDDHKEQLTMLKQVIDNSDKKHAKALKAAYSAYIDGENNKKISFEDLRKRIQKNLDNSETSKKINDLLEHDYFLPKQRSKENGAIPHQLQQQELDKIIESQKHYYPFLAELNPNEKRSRQAKYKLDELVAFRVPYYVGPMVKATENNQSNNGKFAWMIKNDNISDKLKKEEITPWNFDKKVDRTETATKFITRMTTTDTYLIGEPVLPKNSLLYQKFVVLNELNNLKINKQPITPEQKQYVYEHVMKQTKRVSLKKIADALVIKGDYPYAPEITGTTDQKNMNNGLSTYIDLAKIFGDELDDIDRKEDFEKIIEWSTIFEDQHIFALKLKEIKWLTEDQRKQVVKLRYQGWGKLSKKLLADLVDDNGQRIIDLLWDSKQDFMQIVNQNSFKQAIAEHNGAHLEEKDLKDIINNLYTSPQNKKAIRQVILVVDDIIRAVGYEPVNIMMEFAREDSKDHRLTNSRSRQLEKVYKDITNSWFDDDNVKDELKDKIKDKAKFTDRLYLYFTQGGKDLYTGEPLDIDNLSNYQIDHILPQSFILDNSLDNRVLTSKINNQIKKDNLPGEFFGSKMHNFWKHLKELHLISNKKYYNLTLTPNSISKFNNQGRFINRQLVETRQVIKLAAEILHNRYSEENGTNIVTVKANLTHHMREKFNFYKNRNVNDYHHAFDAYLAAFVGNWLLQQYPKLKPYFVYGDFAKTEIDNLKSFNLIYKFEQAHQLNEEDGKIAKDTDALLGYMKNVYHFKKMLVTKELETNHGNLFKQTLYPSHGKMKNLINPKENRSSDIYGGYSSETGAYVSLIKVFKKNKIENKIIKIPLLYIDKLNRQANAKQFIRNFIIKDDSNKFDILSEKIFLNQLVIDGDELFTISGSGDRQNAQQLILSDKSLKILSKNINVISKNDLIIIFNEIIDDICKYMKMYEVENSDETKAKFEEINDKDRMLKIINDLLLGLHANASRSNLSSIGLSPSFGRFFSGNAGIKLSENAKFIYQSPTGLFSRKVKISDL
ncbi:type II CRISPR RNA-guided endonuclease Cas9 [Fructilactobacillus lindneri]|uniref:type II CRISPR RNA-guided endonuclease Cas9 n=1 Tax=Fructilactobacillus lindneri TaxID=53444 RepID=UPI000CD46A2B|nr:type II CRISPR RNA-guided endonuclease Cas9 [Fructilactobacillus lindneri]POH05277.1 type II CRISPR RNA-guided endonuclease Cas9 [Fructilactobacillus lindneri]